MLFLSYQMTYHLVSTDPDNYGKVKFRSSISGMNSLVMYRINSLSTFASFSLTTPDDYLIISTTVEDQCIDLTLHFREHGAYEMRTLSNYLNTLFEGQIVPMENQSLPIELTITMDSTNRLVISANKEFTIKEASYGARLILGLYHAHLPIDSTNKKVMSPSVPYLSYGNVLYLTARTDFVSTLNFEDKEITRSIAYKVNELLYSGIPICCKLPGSWSIIHSDQLSTLEFQLVDFQLHPVKLHSPLYLTLEVERLDNSFMLSDKKAEQKQQSDQLITEA